MTMGESTSIFLADDDLDDCFLFEEALNTIPLETHLTITHNGVELMNVLEIAEDLPHILFMDLNMPLKTGFECLQEIKQNEKLKDLDVVIMSTFFTMENSDKLMKLGAMHYLQKPNDLLTLTNAIHHVLNVTMEKVKHRND